MRQHFSFLGELTSVKERLVSIVITGSRTSSNLRSIGAGLVSTERPKKTILFFGYVMSIAGRDGTDGVDKLAMQ